MIRIVKTEKYDPSRTLGDSPLAHQYCQGTGIEFGAAAHNPFNLPDCINVDCEDGFEVFRDYQINFNGCYADVDVFADAAEYVHPSPVDYIITSHVVEHFPNPLKVFHNWNKSLKPGGIVFMIVPKRDAVPEDAKRPVSSREEIEHAFVTNRSGIPQAHHFVYTLDLMLDLILGAREMLGWEILDARATDDKIGNGFIVVCRKTGGWAELLKQMKGKIVVFFGAGAASRKIARNFPLHISYLVDNNPKTWGQPLLGARVENPTKLKEEDPANLAVVVASQYYAEILQQLQAMGLEENRHFWDGLSCFRLE